MNYLEFYKERLEKGTLPNLGLCNSIPSKDLRAFRPYDKDLKQIHTEGGCRVYWASGLPRHSWSEPEESQGFTPLRQNIVLFLAAIKDQL